VRKQPGRSPLRILLDIVVFAAAALLTYRALAPDWPPLHEREFHVQRTPGNPVVVTPEKPLILPLAFADCDLQVELELAPGTTLDCVVRKAEPRRRGGDLPAFHARFALLRLATGANGDPWLDRDAALFGGATGGAPVPAGRRCTLAMQLRGRGMTASLDGSSLGAAVAADDWGDHAIVVRGDGAQALVHDLRIVPVAAGPLPRDALALTGIYVVLAVLLLLRPQAATPWLLLAGAAAAELLLFAALAPSTSASPLGAFAAILCGVPLALVPLGRWLPVGLLGSLLLLGLACYVEAPRVPALADPRLDLQFGSNSGSAPFQALSRQIEGVRAIATLGDPRPRVLLLGGIAFWESSGQPASMPAAQLEGPLRAAIGRPASIAAPGTIDANAYQQYLLLREHLLPYRPDAILFGIAAYESEPSEPATARARAGAGKPWPPSLLWRWALPRDGAPASTPAELAATLDDLHALCARERIPLLLATMDGLAAPYLDAVRAFARRSGTPLHERIVTESGEPGELAPLVAELAARLR
jgi:hypothetical protein